MTERQSKVHVVGDCRMHVTVDSDDHAHATIEVAPASGGTPTVLLVVDRSTVDTLQEVCDVARMELTRVRHLDWTPLEVCPDKLWEFTLPLLPVGLNGRPSQHRSTFSAVMYILVNECRWSDLPARFGVSWQHARRRFREWQRVDLWETLYRATYLYPETYIPVVDDDKLPGWCIQLLQRANYRAGNRAMVDEELKNVEGPPIVYGYTRSGRHALRVGRTV